MARRNSPQRPSKETETDTIVSGSQDSFDTKSSMSGSAASSIYPPKPFAVILALALFMLLMASIGGLSTSAVDFRTPSKAPGNVAQSFIMFSSLISPVYILLHIFVSFRDVDVTRRQPLQSPVVSWTVIVARLGLVLWIVTVVLTSVTVTKKGFNTIIGRSNVAISIFGVLCLSVLNLTIEIAAEPFALPFAPRRTTVTCLVSSFEDDLKGGRNVRHYRTVTLDSTSSSRPSSRSSSTSSGTSRRKRYSPPPSPPSRHGYNKRCTTIFEEAGKEPEAQTRHQQQQQQQHRRRQPSFDDYFEQSRGDDRPPQLPEMHFPKPPAAAHVPPPPPGTAWANDWEALAVETGVKGDDGSFVSDFGVASPVTEEERPQQQQQQQSRAAAAGASGVRGPRQPPPAIVVTPV